MLRKRQIPQSSDWVRLQSFSNEVYRKASLLRQESAAAPSDPTAFFNPNECLQRVSMRTKDQRPQSKRSPAKRSFDRLFTNASLSAMLKGLKPVSLFRQELDQVMNKGIKRHRSVDRISERLEGREFSTLDLGKHSDNLKPLFAQICPERFSRPASRMQRSPSPLETRDSRAKRSPLKPRERPRRLLWKNVDRSLLKGKTRPGDSNGALKEWEISLSMHANRVLRRRDRLREISPVA